MNKRKLNTRATSTTGWGGGSKTGWGGGANEAGARSRKPKHADTLVNTAVLCLLVAVLLGIGGTLAQVTNAVKHNENKGYIDARLVQTYGQYGDKAVYPGYTESRTCVVENYGSEVAYVRVRLDKYWANRTRDAAGNETLTREEDPAYNTEYIHANLTGAEKWVDGEDGWYYYSDAVAPGSETESLLQSVGIDTQVGEERNDMQSTERDYNSESSIYLSKVGVLDVELQAVTTEYDPGTPDSGGDTGGTTADGDSKFRAAQSSAQAAFAPETGDAVSHTALVLFGLAIIALLLFLLLLIAARRRRKEEEQQAFATAESSSTAPPRETITQVEF